MGEGEDYLCEISDWLIGISQDERRAYLLSNRAIPDCWMLWAVEWYAFPQEDEAALDEAWEALATRA